MSYHRVPRLDVSDLYRGNPHDPDAAFVFARNGWTWTQLQAYYRKYPWPAMYLRDIEMFMTGVPDIIYEGLPFPQLIRNGDYSHLAAIHPNFPRLIWKWHEEYTERVEEWRQIVEGEHAQALIENEHRKELTAAEAPTVPSKVGNSDDK